MRKRSTLGLLLLGITLLLLGIGELQEKTAVVQLSPTPIARIITISPVPTAETLGEQTQASPSGDTQTFIVARVVDGDTIKLASGQTIRYIGIDTPETKDPRRGVQCYGKEAYEKNKELVEGKQVVLEKDISETDRYGRLLRYVYINGVFINDYLVREGFAHASTYPPDVKYQEQFRNAQKEARENNKGLWALCGGD